MFEHFALPERTGKLCEYGLTRLVDKGSVFEQGRRAARSTQPCDGLRVGALPRVH